jgi:hypothetical protein
MISKWYQLRQWGGGERAGHRPDPSGWTARATPWSGDTAPDKGGVARAASAGQQRHDPVGRSASAMAPASTITPAASGIGQPALAAATGIGTVSLWPRRPGSDSQSLAMATGIGTAGLWPRRPGSDGWSLTAATGSGGQFWPRRPVTATAPDRRGGAACARGSQHAPWGRCHRREPVAAPGGRWTAAAGFR